MKRSILWVWIVMLGAHSQFSFASLLEDHYEAGRIAYLAGNYSSAKKELDLPATQGHPDAQALLGKMYYKGEGMSENYHEAFKWWQLAAQQGDATSQTALAYLYENGKGVRQDYHKAFKWYQLAAIQNHAPAQGLLAMMYYGGRGVRQDRSQAKEWFGKACDNGCQIGCDEYRKMN